MRTLGARWTVTETASGRLVVYENLERGLTFNCGVEPLSTPFDLIVEFIIQEGDPGDLVFLNGKFYTQLQKEMSA